MGWAIRGRSYETYSKRGQNFCPGAWLTKITIENTKNEVPPIGVTSLVLFRHFHHSFLPSVPLPALLSILGTAAGLPQFRNRR